MKAWVRPCSVRRGNRDRRPGRHDREDRRDGRTAPAPPHRCRPARHPRARAGPPARRDYIAGGRRRLHMRGTWRGSVGPRLRVAARRHFRMIVVAASIRLLEDGDAHRRLLAVRLHGPLVEQHPQDIRTTMLVWSGAGRLRRRDQFVQPQRRIYGPGDALRDRPCLMPCQGMRIDEPSERIDDRLAREPLASERHHRLGVLLQRPRSEVRAEIRHHVHGQRRHLDRGVRKKSGHRLGFRRSGFGRASGRQLRLGWIEESRQPVALDRRLNVADEEAGLPHCVGAAANRRAPP